MKNKQLEAVKTFCTGALRNLEPLIKDKYQTDTRRMFMEGSKSALEGVLVAIKDIEEKGQ